VYRGGVYGPGTAGVHGSEGVGEGHIGVLHTVEAAGGTMQFSR